MSGSSFVELNMPQEEDERALSDINTTPLVDVMLVLLIVFMITIPVITHTVPVDLPEVSNEATKTKPENINISVNKEGQVFWNQVLVKDNDDLLQRMGEIAVMQPQPEVHIRADQQTRYENVGRVIVDAQRKGIMKVGFITLPGAQGQPVQ
jgi:biopolymer transport protein ExbD